MSMLNARRLVAPVLAALLPFGALAGAAAAADGVLNIRYGMTVAGFPIGTANLDALIRNDNYQIEVTAKVGGLLSLVSDGRGAASANGRISAAQPRAVTYSLATSSDRRQTAVRMAMGGGSVRSLEIAPEPMPRPDRIPVTAAHRRGVLDPVSALLMPVTGRGEVLSSQACKRRLPVFDGAQRYDITLSYSRTERVTSDKGYSGPVIVCSARYTPIAGHRERREQTRAMAANRDMEVWLAPVGGTRVLAPHRIVVGTPAGQLVIAARSFETSDTTVSASAD